MRARSVVDANIHAPRYRGAGATASRQMRVELGAAARPANPDPQVRVEPSAPSAASASFAAAPPAAAARPAAPPLCALNHYRRWTGYVRPNRPVGDGALLDEFETVDDLRWAEGAGGALDAPP